MNSVKLGDVCLFQEGYVNPSQDDKSYFGDDIKWLRASDLNDGFVYNTDRKLSIKGFKSAGKSSVLFKPETIAISKSGSIGHLGILKDFMCGNRAVINIEPKPELADLRYVFYFLKYNKQRLIKSAGGSIQKNLYVSILEPLILNHSDLPIQQKIAAVLSALDDKIELNNKINAELEAMAKTLYDYWFVQFDFPFDFAQGKPNAEGKPYKSSGGKMVYNETLKREIPEGWEVKSLYSLASFINGLACQKYRPTNEVDLSLPVIKIREMNDGISSNTEKVRYDIPEKYIINNGDILFSWSATLDVKIWTEGKGGLNQHIFKVVSDKYPKSFYYFELLNYLHHFKMMAELRKTTMGHITIDHLKSSFVSIPNMSLIKSLDEKITPILNKVISNKKQNQELAQLRDWLLPMLMNGQVQVGTN